MESGSLLPHLVPPSHHLQVTGHSAVLWQLPYPYPGFHRGLGHISKPALHIFNLHGLEVFCL